MKLKINFTLKSGITGDIPVIANLNFGYKEFDVLKQIYVYKPIRYYTTIHLNRYEWDIEKKRPVSESKNAELLKLEEKIKEIFNYLKMKGELTPAILKAELDEKIKGKDSSKIVNRVRVVDFLNNEMAKSNKFKEKTKASYRTLANKVESFEKSIGKLIYSNEINEDMYQKFMANACSKMTKQNSVWSVQKDFKSTLREIARKYKIIVFNPSVELASKDKVQIASTDNIYLNFKQIKKIIDYQPESDKLKQTKLILLTLIFTGCRESDVYKIEPKHLYNNKGVKFHYAQFFSQKTDTEIIVPILKPLADAIKENGGLPAIPMNRTVFNRNVKDLIEECKITENVTITYVDTHGKKQFQTKKFHLFVSSHIGRRSFITNLINFIPLPILTKITGHSLSDKSIIFGYNKISLLDNVVLFRKQLKQACRDNPDHFLFQLV